MRTVPAPDEPASVFDAFAAAAGRWPDRPMLAVLPETAAAYGIEAGETSYAAAARRVEAIRAALRAAGAVPGMRAMLLLENRPDFFLHWLALNAEGLSVVPINPDLRAAELAHMTALTRPAVAFTIPGRADDLSGAGVPLVLPAFHDAPLPPLTGGPVFDPAGDPRAREAAVLFTSGSTGAPKGCVLPNDYFLRAGAWYAAEGGLCALDPDRPERMLTPLPIFHMNAMAYSFMAMLAVGGCLIALDRFHPRTWWDSVAASRATCLHYLGVMPSMLMGLPEAPADRAHAVRFGFGAGVDPKLHGPFEDRFGFPLIEAWAMTETGAGAVIAASQLPRRLGESALGRPGPGMEMRIVAEDGRDVAPGEPGELLVRAAGDDPRRGFFREYLDQPEATTEAWADGWFHTGDVVRQAPDGQVHFVDRRKNVIRRSGENIAAVEVESVLMRHPQVQGAAVTAVADAVRGDEVFAFLVTDAEPQAVVDWALSQMAYYKVPGWIARLDRLPLTATNKLSRGEVKAMAAAALAEGSATDTRAMKRRQA